jgi:hypothetical protein
MHLTKRLLLLVKDGLRPTLLEVCSLAVIRTRVDRQISLSLQTLIRKRSTSSNDIFSINKKVKLSLYLTN